jgi:hypothetical protein
MIDNIFGDEPTGKAVVKDSAPWLLSTEIVLPCNSTRELAIMSANPDSPIPVTRGAAGRL